MPAVQLIRDPRWSYLPDLVVSALEVDLRGRLYAQPIGGAHIVRADLAYSEYGIDGEVEIIVTVAPSQEELRHFYDSGLEGAVAPPTLYDMCHTVEIHL